MTLEVCQDKQIITTDCTCGDITCPVGSGCYNNQCYSPCIEGVYDKLCICGSTFCDVTLLWKCASNNVCVKACSTTKPNTQQCYCGDESLCALNENAKCYNRNCIPFCGYKEITVAESCYCEDIYGGSSDNCGQKIGKVCAEKGDSSYDKCLSKCENGEYFLCACGLTQCKTDQSQFCWNGKCVEEIPSYDCSKTAPNCATCQVDTYQCLSCQPNYTLSNGSCICSADELTCADHFICVTGKCIHDCTNIATCLQCVDNDKQKCLKCDKNYIPSADGMSCACGDSQQQCANFQYCSGGVCTNNCLSTIDHCSACDSTNAGVCTDCNKSYSLQNQLCKKRNNNTNMIVGIICGVSVIIIVVITIFIVEAKKKKNAHDRVSHLIQQQEKAQNLSLDISTLKPVQKNAEYHNSIKRRVRKHHTNRSQQINDDLVDRSVQQQQLKPVSLTNEMYI